MCPLVFRITTKDAALSFELGMHALDLALGNKIHLEPIDDDSSSSNDGKGVLKIDGHLVIKLLESEDAKSDSLLTSLNNVIDMCPKYNLVLPSKGYIPPTSTICRLSKLMMNYLSSDLAEYLLASRVHLDLPNLMAHRSQNLAKFG
ncbi:hypothetical protein VIGAN_06072500 [Vigna angularis var. angularis]|uniref:Uncharacterized protein n=1 Tax=Vigna angularis var. angularis TaxID=157739 RepID=A0A0S3SA42_PHAAN|nr:hypothetical protein VIGAN_06072500 [Vigna angularis var. angularis]